jgi:hypothetical protein
MRGMLKGVLIAAVALFAFCESARAQVQDNDGCGNWTLKGDYTFTITGQIVHPDETIDYRAGVAMAEFRGDGTFTQEDYVMSSTLKGPTGPPFVFHGGENGTYNVNADCTGDATIVFPNGIQIKLMLVVRSSGAAVHTVVAAVMMPDGTSPGTPIIQSEGLRQPRSSDWAANKSSGAESKNGAAVADKSAAKKEPAVRQVKL